MWPMAGQGGSRTREQHPTALLGQTLVAPGWAQMQYPGQRCVEIRLEDEAGVLLSQLCKGQKRRKRKASKDSVFQNHTYHHSSVVLQGAF